MAAYDGIDRSRIIAELDAHVSATTPKNLSSGLSITSRCAPGCGRKRAIEMTERVRPILDKLYPDWSDENERDTNFEFAAERDACQRLHARITESDEVAEMLAGYDASPQLSAGQLHHLVWRAASARWSTGHRHEAVLSGAKAVNSMLQTKLGRRDLSEGKLIQEALSKDDALPGKPRLRFSTIEDEQTRESMRHGVMNFGAGCFHAIRNPVGHLPNEENELSEQEALERLAALSLLARWIDEAEIVSA